MVNVSRNKTILFNLDPGSIQSGNFVYEFSLYQPSNFEIIVSNYQESVTQSVRIPVSDWKLIDLRAYIDIFSLKPVEPVKPDPIDSEYALSLKTIQNDLQFPSFLLELGLRTELTGLITLSRLRLQNRRPGYYINLMRYFTIKSEFNGDQQTEIVVRIIRTDGAGFPTYGDLIQIWGQVQELGWLLPPNSNSSTSQLQIAGTINTIVSGSLQNGGNDGGNGGNELTPRLTIDNQTTATHVVVYFVTELPSGNDLSGIIPSERLATTTDLTDVLQGIGGYYIFISCNIDAGYTFFPSQGSIASCTPVGAATIYSSSFSDILNGAQSSVNCIVLNLTGAPAQISLVLTD